MKNSFEVAENGATWRFGILDDIEYYIGDAHSQPSMSTSGQVALSQVLGSVSPIERGARFAVQFLHTMPRDPGLEELVHGALGDLPGLTEKAMFGGWAFLLRGNLLCGTRRGSLMLRVGRDNEVWALDIPGIIPVVMRGRRLHGYVRATPEAYGDDTLLQRLLDAAVSFTRSLPRK